MEEGEKLEEDEEEERGLERGTESKTKPKECFKQKRTTFQEEEGEKNIKGGGSDEDGIGFD